MGVTLYHNAASTCSVKARLALVEKGVEFESQHVDLMKGEQHDPEYVKLNPNHVVPTLVHDGKVMIESSLIIQYVDEAFSGPSLVPGDPYVRHQMRLGLKKVDEKLQPFAGIVTYAIGPRTILLQKSEAEREAAYQAIPDPKKRAIRRSVVENGIKAPEFRGALEGFVNYVDSMEQELKNNPWLAGAEFSLADIGAIPYIIRLNDLAMAPIFGPRVQDWFARFQARPSFEIAVTKWVPPPLIQLLNTNGKEVWADVEKLVAEIRG